MKPKKDKTDKIRKTLRDSPRGLWVREIARKSGMDKSTVSRYLVAMHEELDFDVLGRNKVYRLRGRGEV
ncbi:MAG: helix-turn-helix domain-containing protein [archaeon]|nr:helix-turn-helix domain-containing protein [archaeon]